MTPEVPAMKKSFVRYIIYQDPKYEQIKIKMTKA